VYIGYNVVAFKNMGSASLIKEMSVKTPTFIIVLTVSMKKFLMALMDKLK
jgi:hypothetical protein